MDSLNTQGKCKSKFFSSHCQLADTLHKIRILAVKGLQLFVRDEDLGNLSSSTGLLIRTCHIDADPNQIFHYHANQDRILLLIKSKEREWSTTGLQTLHGSILSLHASICERQRSSMAPFCS
jgi:hypothetical protein